MKYLMSLVLLVLMLGTVVGQHYPSSQHSSNLINLYKQADTKGVVVIGSGVPVYVPRAKQSRIYVDSVAGDIYIRDGGAWKMISSGDNFANADLEQTGARYYNAKDHGLFMDSIRTFDVWSNNYLRLMSGNDIIIDGNKSLELGSQRFDVNIPSRGGKPEGAILYLTAGDSLMYSSFGIKPGVPVDGSVLVYDSGSAQYKAKDFLKFLPVGTGYDNDADAAVNGVAVGQYYVLSAANTLGLPEGVVKRRLL